MYRSHSPYGQPQHGYPAAGVHGAVPGYPPGAPAGAPGFPSGGTNPMAPGDVIFARQVSPTDGSTVYQLFRAMPASVPTATGYIHGLQWMAAEQVVNPPAGSKPADSDIIEAWQRGAIQSVAGFPGLGKASSSASKSSKEESSKRRHSRHPSDYSNASDTSTQLHTARERDRRSSFNASTAPQPNMSPFPGYAPFPGYGPPQQPGQQQPQAQPPAGYPMYSGYGPPHDPSAAPGPYGTPQPPAQYAGAYGTPGDLAQRLGELDLKNRSDSASDRKKKEKKEKESRSRRQSMHEPSRPPTTAPAQTDVYGYPTAGPYGLPPAAAAAAAAAAPGAAPAQGGYGAPAAGYPNASPYMHQGMMMPAGFNASPNARPGEMPAGYPAAPYPVAASQSSHGGRKSSSSMSSSNSGDVWGPGHILEGQPKQPGANTGFPARSKSRAASPNPGAMGGPAMPGAMPGGYYGQQYPQQFPQQPQPQAQPRPASRHSHKHSHSQGGSPNPQLAAPESFSRGINATLPFSKFPPTTIHKMDDFFSHMPKMPQNLESHDVGPKDWWRFCEDMTLAWTGRLPVPPPRDGSSSPPRPAVIAAELIHTWNTAFFEPRGIEIVLYKGVQRRSGRLFGREDLVVNSKADMDDYSSSSTSDESSSDADDDSDDPYPRAKGAGAYRNSYGGRDGFMDELAAARKRYWQQKELEKKERRERRQRRRERRKRRRYIVQAICIRDGPPNTPPKNLNHAMGPPGMPNAMAGPGAVPGMPNATPLTSAYPGMLGVGMPPAGKNSKRMSSGGYELR